MEAESLDEIAVLEGTDKSSLDHDYIRHYEQAFQKFRHEPIDFLEIGVADGASLRMWQRYFSQARLIGADIIPDCARYAGGRILVEIGSQADPEFLLRLARKYSPTIIIDDGSHQAGHIRQTIEHLFPALQPGGCYVIEDLHFHNAPDDPGQPAGALKMVLDLAFRTTKNDQRTVRDSEIARYFMNTVDRVEFVRHAALIWKRIPDPNPVLTVAGMRDLVEKSGSPQNWFRFVHYSLNRGGTLRDAEVAARNAISLGDVSGLSHWRLSEVLETQGDFENALAAIRMALGFMPGNPDIELRRDRLISLVHDA
jgi:hypothetical protein